MLADKIQLHQAAAALTASVVAHLGAAGKTLDPTILSTIATKLGIDPSLVGSILGGASGGSLTVDPTMADPATRTMDLEVAELQRIFYHWLSACCNDASWPDPGVVDIKPATPAIAATPVPALK